MAKTVDGEDAVAGAAIGMEEAEAAEEGLEAVAVAAEDMAADSSTMARVPRWE